METPNHVDAKFLLRHDIISEWETKNPVLEYGEAGIGYNLDDSGKVIDYVIKMGDGITPWNDLVQTDNTGIIAISDNISPEPWEKPCKIKSEIFNDYVNNVVTAKGTHVEGRNNFASGKYAHVEGFRNTLLGDDGHAEGYGTMPANYVFQQAGKTLTKNLSADEIYSQWWDPQNNNARFSLCRGTFGHSEGQDSVAYGESSHAQGRWTFAEGNHSHAEGSGSVAKGYASHAQGSFSKAIGEMSFAGGQEAQAEGNNSVAVGLRVIAKGNGSVAFGLENQAAGEASAAFGKDNMIFNNGYDPLASLVVGYQNRVGGGYAFATGTKSIATHYGSNVLGSGLISNTQNSTVVGKFNKPDATILFGVGNGTGDISDITFSENGCLLVDGDSIKRQNAFTVHEDGHAEIQTQGETDNSITTLSYVNNEVEKQKNYIDEQTKLEHSTMVNIYELDRQLYINNAEYIKISCDPSEFLYSNYIEDGEFSGDGYCWRNLNSLGEIIGEPYENRYFHFNAINNSAKEYYAGTSLWLGEGSEYIFSMRIRGKIGVFLDDEAGFSEGAGWHLYDVGDEWKNVQFSFICGSDITETAPAFAFGMPLGETTEGADMDNIIITSVNQIKAYNGSTLFYDELIDIQTGEFPTIIPKGTNTKIVFVAGIPYYTCVYGKNLSDTVKSLEENIVSFYLPEDYASDSRLTTAAFVEGMVDDKLMYHSVDASQVFYTGAHSGTIGENVSDAIDYIMDNAGGGGAPSASVIPYHGESYIGGTTVEEALDNASNKILDLDMIVPGKSDIGHFHISGDIQHFIFDEAGEPIAQNVGEAIDYLFENAGGGTSSGGSSAAQVSFDNSYTGLEASNTQDAIDQTFDKIMELQSAIPGGYEIIATINSEENEQILSSRIAYVNTTANVDNANAAFNYLFESIGTIDTALNNIIEIQNNLIGGNN